MAVMWIIAKEPPDRAHKSLKDYAKMLVERDAWIFNLIYSVTFGGFIGLASFLPTLFHDHYHIPKQHVGIYVTVGVIAASGLRVVGGWLADHMGGIRVLYLLCGLILAGTLGAASLPSSPITMAFVVAPMIAPVLGGVKQALASSLHDVFLIGTIVVAVGVAFALLIKDAPLRKTNRVGPPTPE